MNHIQGKKILITGGGGFLGSFVVEKLKEKGCKDIIVPRSREYNLCSQEVSFALVKKARPDILIHLAAAFGGIEANRLNAGKFLYDNLAMGIHLMEAARQADVEKFVTCGSVCSYPKYAPIPLKEEGIWDGYPDEITAGYGLAKKLLLAQGQEYRRQYGFQAIHMILVNLYGPRDRFDSASSNVVAALIRRCQEAKAQGQSQLTVWGSGKATREFLYVEDAANAIIMAAEKYNGEMPVNIGTGIETPIRTLAELIAKKTGFQGNLVWDTSKPDGHPRRYMDVQKAKDFFGFEAKVNLEEGIHKTVEWYMLQDSIRLDSKQ